MITAGQPHGPVVNETEDVAEAMVGDTELGVAAVIAEGAEAAADELEEQE